MQLKQQNLVVLGAITALTASLWAGCRTTGSGSSSTAGSGGAVAPVGTAGPGASGPLSLTVSDGSRLTARVGEELRFFLSASAGGGPVNVDLLQPPPGLTFDPARNATGVVNRTVEWLIQPSSTGLQSLRFTAQVPGDPASFTVLEVQVQVLPALGGAGQGIQFGDVTGDGVLDLIAVTPDADNGSSIDEGAIYVWAGATIPAGDPSFTLRAVNPGRDARIGIASGQGVQLADLNGDGVQDLVVGASAADLVAQEDGAIYIWLGGAGLTSDPTYVLGNPNAVDGDRLGNVGQRAQGIVISDITGDNRLDIIAGASNADVAGTDNGAVYLWLDIAGLAGTTATIVPPDVTLTIANANDNEFLGQVGSGQGILTGDVTGDGINDLVVAAPETDGGGFARTGVVYLWEGGPAIGGTPSSLDPETPISDDTFFGNAGTGQGILLEDVTGDGVRDVIVAAPGEDSAQGADTGAVYVFPGGVDPISGLPRLFPAFLDRVKLDAPIKAADDEFGNGISGTGVLAEDVTGDGVKDVVVASPLIDAGDTDRGQVLVWAGGTTLNATGDPDPTASLTGATGGDQLGNAGVGQGLFLKNVTGDATADVVIVTSRLDRAVPDAGGVLVFEGGPTLAGSPSPTALLSDPNAQADDRAGEAASGGVILRDVTGDNVPDLILLAPSADRGGSDRGAAYVWAGGSGLVGASPPAAVIEIPAGSVADGDGLGGGASVIGDVTGDGLADIVLGAPLADLGGTDRGGIVVWDRGAQLISGTAGVNSASLLQLSGATDDDRLGIASGQGVILADVTGDGILDVVAGAAAGDLGGTRDAGLVAIFNGGPALGTTSQNVSSTTPRLEDQLTNVGAGQGLLVSDLDRDGIDELIAGQSAADEGGLDRGSIMVFQGGSLAGSLLAVSSAQDGDGLGAVGVAAGGGAGAAPWPNSRAITLNNAGSSQSNYQVLVTLPATFDYNNLGLPNGGDIRFATGQPLQDGVNTIPHFIDGGVNVGGRTNIWVQVPNLPAGPSTIFLFYGNSNPSVDLGPGDFDGTFPPASRFVATNGQILPAGGGTWSWFEVPAGVTLELVQGPTTTTGGPAPSVVNARRVLIAGTIDGAGKGFVAPGISSTSGVGPGPGISASGEGGAGGGYGGFGGHAADNGNNVSGGMENGTLDTPVINYGSSGGTADNRAGNGGGALEIRAGLVTVNGTIDLSGEAGSNGTVNSGSGGGAGGGLLLIAGAVQASPAGRINIDGGDAGDSVASGGWDGGGGGGGGRLKVFAANGFDIQANFQAVVSANGGAGGKGDSATPVPTTPARTGTAIGNNGAPGADGTQFFDPPLGSTTAAQPSVVVDVAATVGPPL